MTEQRFFMPSPKVPTSGSHGWDTERQRIFRMVAVGTFADGDRAARTFATER